MAADIQLAVYRAGFVRLGPARSTLLLHAVMPNPAMPRELRGFAAQLDPGRRLRWLRLLDLPADWEPFALNQPAHGQLVQPNGLQRAVQVQPLRPLSAHLDDPAEMRAELREVRQPDADLSESGDLRATLTNALTHALADAYPGAAPQIDDNDDLAVLCDTALPRTLDAPAAVPQEYGRPGPATPVRRRGRAAAQVWIG